MKLTKDWHSNLRILLIVSLLCIGLLLTTYSVNSNPIKDNLYLSNSDTEAKIIKTFRIYTDEGLNTDYLGPVPESYKILMGLPLERDWYVWWFDGGDGSIDKPPWTIEQDANRDGAGAPNDSSEYIWIRYTNDTGRWGGCYFRLLEPTDLSEYTDLSFWARANTETTFEIWVEDDYFWFGAWQKEEITVGSEWRNIIIPLSEFYSEDLHQVLLPFVISFSDDVTGKTTTVYIDNIQWIKRVKPTFLDLEPSRYNVTTGERIEVRAYLADYEYFPLKDKIINWYLTCSDSTTTGELEQTTTVTDTNGCSINYFYANNNGIATITARFAGDTYKYNSSEDTIRIEIGRCGSIYGYIFENVGQPFEQPVEVQLYQDSGLGFGNTPRAVTQTAGGVGRYDFNELINTFDYRIRAKSPVTEEWSPWISTNLYTINYTTEIRHQRSTFSIVIPLPSGAETVGLTAELVEPVPLGGPQYTINVAQYIKVLGKQSIPMWRLVGPEGSFGTWEVFPGFKIPVPYYLYVYETQFTIADMPLVPLNWALTDEQREISANVSGETCTVNLIFTRTFRVPHISYFTVTGPFNYTFNGNIITPPAPKEMIITLQGEEGEEGWYRSTVRAEVPVSTIMRLYQKSITSAIQVCYSSTFMEWNEEGEYIINADAAGDYLPGTANFKIDKTPPVINKFSLIDETNYTQGGLVWFYLSASDDLSGVKYVQFRVGDEGWSSCAEYSEMCLVSLANGNITKEVTVRVYDTAGNYADNSIIVTVDANPPIASYTENKIFDSSTGRWKTVINFDFIDSGAGIGEINYAINEGDWHSLLTITSPTEEMGAVIEHTSGEVGDHIVGGKLYLLPGVWTFHYHAVDVLGNQVEDSWDFIAIDSPPFFTISIAESTINGWYNTEPTVTIAVNPEAPIATGSVAWSKSGAENTWVAYSGPFKVGGEGGYDLWVRGRDITDALRFYVVKAMTNICVDLSAPNITITPSGTIGDDGWYISPVGLNISLSDISGIDLASLEYSIDNSRAWESYSSAQLITKEGVHYLVVRVRDIVGHIGQKEFGVLKIDLSQPIIHSISLIGTEGRAGWYISNVTINVRATDNVSGIRRVSIGTYQMTPVVDQSDNYTYTFYGTGVRNVVLSTRDLAGNLSMSPLNIKIDTTPPSPPRLLVGTLNLGGGYLPATITGGDDDCGTVTYEIQISTDVNFTNIVTNITGIQRSGYSTTTMVHVPYEEGVYYIRAGSRNEAGLIAWSDIKILTINRDYVVIENVRLENGEFNPDAPALGGYYFRIPRIPVIINATNVHKMRFSVTQEGLDDISWEEYAVLKIVEIPSNDGEFRIWAELQGVENCAASFALTGYLDMTPPRIIDVSLWGALINIINTPQCRLRVVADDRQSGLKGMLVWVGATTTNNWTEYREDVDITLPSGGGEKIIHVKVIDRAGNESEERTIVVVLDTTRPLLTVDAPSSTTQKSVLVRITTEPNASILLNDTYAKSADNTGYLEYVIYMREVGINRFTFIAIDLVGNTSDPVVVNIEYIYIPEGVPISSPTAAALTALGLVVMFIVSAATLRKYKPSKKKEKLEIAEEEKAERERKARAEAPEISKHKEI